MFKLWHVRELPMHVNVYVTRVATSKSSARHMTHKGLWQQVRTIYSASTRGA